MFGANIQSRVFSTGSRSAFLLIFLTCLLFKPCSEVYARPTTVRDARQVVGNWLSLDHNPLGSTLGERIKEVRTYRDQSGSVIYYVIYLDPSGFVIVPADDLVEPILGFISRGRYNPSSKTPLGALVGRDVRSRIMEARDTERQALGQGADHRTAAGHREAKAKWQMLKSKAQVQQMRLKGSVASNKISDLRVAPLLGSTWGQSWVGQQEYCYNYYTPNHYVCGCVATAMAQLMRYHRYPTRSVGTSSFSIYVDNQPQTRSLRGGDGRGGTYDWDNMLLVPDQSVTETQRMAIGALTHDAGVAVRTGYHAEVSGSNAKFIPEAMTDTFKFTNAKRMWRDDRNLPINDLLDMVNPNLDSGLPVLLELLGGGSIGHVVVADGYGFYVSTRYHHLNMGWNGQSDAWYNLPKVLSPRYKTVTGCTYNIFTSGTGQIISGRVLDTDGNPITGACVLAMRSEGGAYTATTDSRGIYALPNLPSFSTYTLTASEPGCSFVPKVLEIAESNLRDVKFRSISLAAALQNNRLAFTSGGDAPWFGQTSVRYSGASAAQSGAIADSRSSWLQTIVTGPGTLSFYWKISSELGCDFLDLTLDDTPQHRISGDVEWQQFTIYVPSGSHTIKWSYGKDYSLRTGSDCAWLDKVVYTTRSAASSRLR